MDLYKNKYFKYKNKYLHLKNLIGGSKRKSKDIQLKEKIKIIIPTINDDIIRIWTNFFKKYASKSIDSQEIQKFKKKKEVTKHINYIESVPDSIHASQVEELVKLICEIYEIKIQNEKQKKNK